MLLDQLKKTYKDNIPKFNKFSKFLIITVWVAAIIKSAILLLSVFTNGGTNGIINALTKLNAKQPVKNQITHDQIMQIFQRNLTIAIASTVVLIIFAILITVTLLKTIAKSDYLHLKRIYINLLLLFCFLSFLNILILRNNYSITFNLSEIWYYRLLNIVGIMSYVIIFYIGWQELRYSKLAMQIDLMMKSPLFNNPNQQQNPNFYNQQHNNFNQNQQQNPDQNQQANNQNQQANNQNANNDFSNMTQSTENRIVQVNTWKEINKGDSVDEIQKNNEAIHNKIQATQPQSQLNNQNITLIPQPDPKTDFTKFHFDDLKALAENIGITDYKSMTKAELINILTKIQN